MTIPLLILCPIAEHQLGILSQRFDVTYAITDVAREQAIQERGQAFRAVLTIGTIGLSGERSRPCPGWSWCPAWAPATRPWTRPPPGRAASS